MADDPTLTYHETPNGPQLKLNSLLVEVHGLAPHLLLLWNGDAPDYHPVHITREEAQYMAAFLMHFYDTGELLRDDAREVDQ